VIPGLACPSRPATVRMPTPLAARVVAVKWRSEWNVTWGRSGVVAQGPGGARHSIGSIGGEGVEVLWPHVGGRADGDPCGCRSLIDQLAVVPEQGDGGGIQSDPPSLMGLGVLHLDPPAGIGDGSCDDHRGGVEVDVHPAQAAQLSSTSPSCRGDEDQAAQLLMGIGTRLQEEA
jgi:hypothetical protein